MRIIRNAEEGRRLLLDRKPLEAEELPGGLDEDSPHGFSRGREEVPATVELLVPDQPQIGLVNKCRGVERVPRRFSRHAGGRELSQLVVDEREQLGRGPGVTVRGRIE